MELPAEVDGTLDALLFRLRVDQRATRRGDEASARRELRSQQPDTGDLSRRLLLADAVRACLERAVASKERALLAAEAREAAARVQLQAGCRAEAVVQLAWREADEWQRRAREAEEAQRQALSLLAAAAAAPAPTGSGDGQEAFTPAAHDSSSAAVQARLTAQLHATQRALAAAEAELQQQSALVRACLACCAFVRATSVRSACVSISCASLSTRPCFLAAQVTDMAAALECAHQLHAQAEARASDADARASDAVSSAAVERLAAAADADAALEAHALDVRAAAAALAAQAAAAHDAHAELDAARAEALEGALARASMSVPRGAPLLLHSPRLSAGGGAREKHD
jgi:hypothetical protein